MRDLRPKLNEQTQTAQEEEEDITFKKSEALKQE